jgi:regulation of enolase protein 1 (concanavalin A-like superfamily)
VDADIGSPARAGSASYSSGQFTINASGNDIWNSSDQFHFVYQPLTGDGQIQARVMALSATDVWAKAAVMIRSSVAANSAHAMMTATPGNGVSLQYRTATGQASNYTQGPQQAIPVWVRLVRVGSTFTGSFSINGTTWTTVASQTITMPANVFVGLAVTSHNVGATTTAIISDVTLGAAPPPPPPPTPTPTLSPKLLFTPSADDSTNVTSYRVDIFTVGVNPSTATPVKTQNVGKPTITNGDMVVDLMPIITSISSGSYFCTVTAIGPGGSTRSAASNTFAK